MGCGGSEDKHEAVEVHEPEECCDDTVCDEVRQSCLTLGYKQAAASLSKVPDRSDCCRLQRERRSLCSLAAAIV